MKQIIKSNTLLFCFFLCSSCEDFLDTKPYGTTTLYTLSQRTKGAESLLIAAYSGLDGISIEGWGWTGAASNWIFGSIAGGDAYKGGPDDNDQRDILEIEVHTELNPGNVYLEGKYATCYNGIARANDAIRAFQLLDEIEEDFRNRRIAEARFLRGFYHFELRKIFGKVPYIDETIVDVRIGNSQDILLNIQEDLLYASVHLPAKQDQPGRITKGAAQAYLGITKLWQFDYLTAKIYFDSVINSGNYKLNATYHENFNAEFRNSKESLLEVQQSVNDGTGGANGNYGDILNYPNDGPATCCGFHPPSQNLVNAFKTDENGLPFLDDYNLGSDVTSDEGYSSSDEFIPYGGTLDPRLDWTVGRRGIPYLDWGVHPGRDWARDQIYTGPYTPIKTTVHQSQFADYTGGWINSNGNNLKLLRYADVLLYAAEAEVELGNLKSAEDLVNQVRNRAVNPAGWVHTYIDPDNPLLGFTDIPAANYLIKPYPLGSFETKGKDYAKKAVHFERRLELGMEGHRFFDLVRWGIAAEEKNAYFEVEKTKRNHLKTAYFEKGKNELLPIPFKAIELSYKNGQPTLNQNPGYN
jgi:starch-binding outer membrane protein, SusD/RagB family